MGDAARFTISATVLGTPDPRGLADFYQRLLGWNKVWDEPDWAMLRPDTGKPGLSFQLETEHVPPVWPSRPGDQQMQIHLDIGVDDLDAACAHAEACGARRAVFQPQEDGERVIVFLDPAGHPFCLFPDSEPQASEDGSAGTSTA